ncbi:GNAT family N-acetyltransferase [Kitasatospora sp. NPDC049258]|uniref:GNAT family N-acetyltransferase n=1 Tax=Kitasatospora sp. NPDC049258 TaxID=3155394 RepID=UPI00341A4EFB
MKPSVAPAPVRTATGADAAALHALSAPFIRSGALRRRGVADYRAAAGDFLVAPGPNALDGPEVLDGPNVLDGCVGLRVLRPEPGHPSAGVLYNFCVRGERQGSGLGSGLLEAVLAEAARRGLSTAFTATTGSGALFGWYGFRQVPTALAPRAWTAGLDPARGSRVHVLTLPTGA